MVRQLASEAKVTPANKHPFGFDAADCMAQLSGERTGLLDRRKAYLYS